MTSSSFISGGRGTEDTFQHLVVLAIYRVSCAVLEFASSYNITQKRHQHNSFQHKLFFHRNVAISVSFYTIRFTGRQRSIQGRCRRSWGLTSMVYGSKRFLSFLQRSTHTVNTECEELSKYIFSTYYSTMSSQNDQLLCKLLTKSKLRHIRTA